MPCFYCSKGVFPLIQHRGSSYRYYWFILAVVGQRDWSTSWGEVPRAIQFNFRGAEGTNPDCHFTIGEDTTIESGWELKHKLHHRIITSSFELISLTLSPWVINLKFFSDFFFSKAYLLDSDIAYVWCQKRAAIRVTMGQILLYLIEIPMEFEY